MPDFLQNIDLVTIGLICGGLCVVGVVLLFGLQLIGGLLGTVTGFLGIFVDILAGGPIAWCGCFIFLGACGLCAGAALLIANAIPACETNPIMFCRLLGF